MNERCMTTTMLSMLIREHVFSEKDRYILRRHLIDGATYDQIADEMTGDQGSVPTANGIGKRCRRAMANISQYLT